MTARDDDESEGKRRFALRWETSTPRERRDMLRDHSQQMEPQTTRHAYVLVGLVFMAGAISGLVKAVNAEASALTITTLVVGIVVSGAMAELSRRGRTRLGFSLMVVGMLAAGLVETFQR